jgi:DNA ligase-associated metallophosphoesterase
MAGECSGYRFRLNGAEVEAHPAGVLWWEERRLLAVSDLHLEKGSSFARSGVFLPPYDSAATVARLAALMGALSPARVIAMGDSFHDTGAEARLDPATAARLSGLTRCCDWVWLEGNHDPEPAAIVTGTFAAEWREGPLVFRHEPGRGSSGEVAGHLHPKIRLRTRGRSVAARCFVTDGNQLVMPAFGALTGGLDARSRDIRGVFREKPVALAMGPAKVHAVAV